MKPWLESLMVFERRWPCHVVRIPISYGQPDTVANQAYHKLSERQQPLILAPDRKHYIIARPSAAISAPASGSMADSDSTPQTSNCSLPLKAKP